MDQSLKMGVADRPDGWGEIILMMAYREDSIECLLRRVCDLPIDEKDLLVHLRDHQSMPYFDRLPAFGRLKHTQEFSVIDKMRGAKAEVGILGAGPPLTD